jgi:hypothetical protein
MPERSLFVPLPWTFLGSEAYVVAETVQTAGDRVATAENVGLNETHGAALEFLRFWVCGQGPRPAEKHH